MFARLSVVIALLLCAMPVHAQVANVHAPVTADAGSINYTQTGTGAVSRTVEDKLNEVISVKDFSNSGGQQVQGDCQITTDGTTVASDNTVTCTACTFDSTDVGEKIQLDNAGASGATYVTTISGFNSATSVEVTTAPSSSISGTARIVWGTDDTTGIQAAVDAASASNAPSAVVTFPGARYCVTGNPSTASERVTLAGDITYRGYGGAYLTLWYSTSEHHILTVPSTGGDRINIDGLVLDVNDPEDDSVHPRGIYVDGAAEPVIERSRFVNSAITDTLHTADGIGIEFAGAFTDAVVRYNVFDGLHKAIVTDTASTGTALIQMGNICKEMSSHCAEFDVSGGSLDLLNYTANLHHDIGNDATTPGTGVAVKGASGETLRSFTISLNDFANVDTNCIDVQQGVEGGSIAGNVSEACGDSTATTGAFISITSDSGSIKASGISVTGNVGYGCAAGSDCDYGLFAMGTTVSVEHITATSNLFTMYDNAAMHFENGTNIIAGQNMGFNTGTSGGSSDAIFEFLTPYTMAAGNMAFDDRGTQLAEYAIKYTDASDYSIWMWNMGDDVGTSYFNEASTPTDTLGMFYGNGTPPSIGTSGWVYLRLDGGAGTTLYVNESDTVSWVGK